MSTATQIIARALRKINAVRPNQTVGSDMAADALADLNAMVTRWLDLGIEISQGEIALTDTIPTDIGDEDAVVYNLAKVLLLEYPNPNAILVLRLAEEYYRDILAKYTEVGELQHELGLLPRTNAGYNINTDL